VSERAYRYRKGQASELIQVPSAMQDDEEEALNKLVEVLADRDDTLLEKVLEDVKPTTAEIYNDLRKDLAAGAVIEVLLGSAESTGGVRRLWKALRHDTPMAAETAARGMIEPDGPPLAQIFKTVHAGHTGKLSYARIWRGSIKDGATLGGTRLGGIYRMPGGELAKVAEASEGDLVALGRLDGVPTGATVSPGATPEQLPFPTAPQPVYSLAIATSDHKDDAKLSGALQKQREADPTLSMEQQQDTSETVLHGQGEMHLNSTVDRLARQYNLVVKRSLSKGGTVLRVNAGQLAVYDCKKWEQVRATAALGVGAIAQLLPLHEGVVVEGGDAIAFVDAATGDVRWRWPHGAAVAGGSLAVHAAQSAIAVAVPAAMSIIDVEREPAAAAAEAPAAERELLALHHPGDAALAEVVLEHLRAGGARVVAITDDSRRFVDVARRAEAAVVFYGPSGAPLRHDYLVDVLETRGVRVVPVILPGGAVPEAQRRFHGAAYVCFHERIRDQDALARVARAVLRL